MTGGRLPLLRLQVAVGEIEGEGEEMMLSEPDDVI